MERNKPTTAGDLQLGDRFYKQGDRKKRVLMVHSKSLSHVTTVKPDIAPEFIEHTKGKVNNATPVIFLRNAFEEEGAE